MTKKEALKTPKDAYDWALKNGPCDETRTVCCLSSAYSYYYAETIDRCSKDDTRLGSCKAPASSYAYAKKIDKGPRDDTRTGACKDSIFACNYAKEVDQCFHQDTWNAVKGSYWEQDYPYVPNKVPFSWTPASPVKMNYEAVEEAKATEDSHAGKIYNPITGEWSWF